MAFDAVSRPVKMADRIVDQIEARMRTGELKPGSQLPTEAQLAGQFGVSRSVVREALRSLEAMRLVTSQQGRGSFITDDRQPSISRVLSLSVEADNAAIQELFDFRAELEPRAAALAAQSRSAAALRSIEAILEENVAMARAGDAAGFRRTDSELHATINAASGNRYMAVILSAVRAMQLEVLQPLADVANSVAAAAREHGELVSAIADRDQERAAYRARRHIDSTARRARRHSNH